MYNFQMSLAVFLHALCKMFGSMIWRQQAVHGGYQLNTVFRNLVAISYNCKFSLPLNL